MSDVAEFNEKQIGKMVDRVHAAQVAVLGTMGAHDPADIHESIKLCLEATVDYSEDRYFYGPGFIMEIDRQGSPWPTYTFYVPATKNLYLRPEDD